MKEEVWGVGGGDGVRGRTALCAGALAMKVRARTWRIVVCIGCEGDTRIRAIVLACTCARCHARPQTQGVVVRGRAKWRRA